MGYTAPATLPDVNDSNFSSIIKTQLEAIARATRASNQTTTSLLVLEVLYHAPLKYKKGYICYADGTLWNPGSGEGIYRYDGTTWVFVG